MKTKVRLIVVTLICSIIGITEAQSQNSQKSISNNINLKVMAPKEVVLAYAEALGKGDIPTAFSFFSPEAKWHQPGAHQFAGIKSGTDEIGKMLGGMMEAAKGTFAIKPNGNIMVNGNFVAMPVRFSGTIDDRKIDMTGIDLFEVSNGKIIGVWLFSENQEVEDTFWGK
ncbi:nuclear transport factor 2 family protein [Flagellimonas hadalis]|nr:nuclear transport factor 2 family protein [Allomuricauda hadalis]